MRFKRIADHRDDGSLAAALRRKRFQWFLDLLEEVPRPLRILDVGGTQDFWAHMGFVEEPGVSIVMLNLAPQPVKFENFTSVVGDATDLSAFDDGSFDVVFSNSVIEHVGDLDQQRRMAEEISRVGKHYFVQTPNFFFPIEPHFLFPGFQWLPLRARAWLVRHFDLGWSKRRQTRDEALRAVQSVRLLRRSQLARLFADATIHREKVLGLTKSFVAHR